MKTARRFRVRTSADAVPVVEGARPQLTDREREHVDDVRKVMSRRPFDGSCLRQALLVGRALSSHATYLQIGVAKDTSGVRAHAWLVVDGAVIDDYQVLPSDNNGFVVMPLMAHGSELV
jgi:transglutaminase superfamily protein